MPNRRELTGIADAVAGSFASRNNDVNGYWALDQLYRRAKEVGSLQVTVGQLPQDESEAGEPMESVGTAYRQFLIAHLSKRRPPDSWVVSASVEVQLARLPAVARTLHPGLLDLARWARSRAGVLRQLGDRPGGPDSERL